MSLNFSQNITSFISNQKQKLSKYFQPVPDKVRFRDVARDFRETLSVPTTDERRVQIENERQQTLTPEAFEEETRKRDFDEFGGVRFAGAVFAPDIGSTGPIKKAAGKEAANLIDDYIKSTISKTKPGTKIKTAFKSGLSNFYDQWVDKNNPIRNYAREAKKLGNIKVGQDPEFLIRRYLGAKGVSESKLFSSVTDLQPDGSLKVTGKSLSEVLNPVADNIDDFRALLVAERQVELGGRGIKATSQGDQTAKNVVNALKTKYGESFGVFEEAASGFREYANNAIIDPLQTVGILSKEQASKIKGANQFYAPFQRAFTELESKGLVVPGKSAFSGVKSGIKQIKGSERQIIDPLEAIISETYRVTDVVERARVGNAIANLRNLSDEMADFIIPAKPNVIKVGDSAIPSPTQSKNVIQVWENGKQKFFEVADEALATALKGLSGSEMGMIAKVLSVPTKVLRAGATLTPEFAAKNPVRDQFNAMIFSKFGYNPPVDFVKGIFSTLAKDDTFRLWQASGGDQSMLVSIDRLASQKNLADILSKDAVGVVRTPKQVLKTITASLKNFGKNPLLPLQKISELGEKGTRLGVFGKALKKTNPLEAAFESRDVTIDFGRAGTQGRIVNRFTAFFNARLQGIDKIARAFKESPVQTATKATAYLTIPSILLWNINKDKVRYQELPQWQKDLFWNFVPDDESKPIVRIPKPFELGIMFATVPERIAQWIYDNDPDQILGIGGVLASVGVGDFLPTGLLPIIENTANYSFFKDRPIVSQSLQNLPAELQANNYTSDTAKEIGKLIKVSPAKIEHLTFGYLAGLGAYGLQGIDAILKKTGIVGGPEEPEGELSDVPVVRSFVQRDPFGFGGESVNDFYELLSEAEQAKNGAKKILEEFGPEAALKFANKHPEMHLAKGLRKIASDLSKAREAINVITESETISPEDKRKQIDDIEIIVTEMARQSLILTTELLEK